MTDDAREMWEEVYHDLSADRPGLLGTITARAEAQTVRLAMRYALLDGWAKIGSEHVKAALALWRYCEASAKYVFGDALGDPVADDLLRALRRAGSEGMTRTAIRDLFGRHQNADRVTRALGSLMTSGRFREVQTGGRPAEIWFAVATKAM